MGLLLTSSFMPSDRRKILIIRLFIIFFLLFVLLLWAGAFLLIRLLSQGDKSKQLINSVQLNHVLMFLGFPFNELQPIEPSKRSWKLINIENY